MGTAVAVAAATTAATAITAPGIGTPVVDRVVDVMAVGVELRVGVGTGTNTIAVGIRGGARNGRAGGG